MNDHPEELRHLGIVLFDGVEELDAVGPWEVLADWTQEHPDDGFRVLCLSRDGSRVTGAKGLELSAHCSFDEAPALEVLVHPGGHGTRALIDDPDYLSWIRAQRQSVPLLTSVCTGSLVYAAAGLLRGRRATTHWTELDLLQQLDPTIELARQARFVDEDDVVTSAGVSAGIDMALHLVARLAGADRAREVKASIQYGWMPAAEES